MSENPTDPIAIVSLPDDHRQRLMSVLQQWSKDAGFQQMGISDLALGQHPKRYQQWLDQHYQGDMQYMQRNTAMRFNPALLQPGTFRVLSFRMDYRPDAESRERMENLLQQDQKAYISRYALGRDYHKLIRKRLAAIANQLETYAEEHLEQRAFVDSAPVLERALAEKAGLGWIGKNTMLINPKAGSYFFLGEILTNIDLPVNDTTTGYHCGSCSRCLTSCPTDAFDGAHILDARRCISYLTIELHDAIPEALRKPMGNRVYGCDDCQICCPWNKFSDATEEDDFSPRQKLDDSELLTLFNWSEEAFLTNTAGSPIRRIGYSRWLRNLAVGLGNAASSSAIIAALEDRLNDRDNEAVNPMVREHIEWALQQQRQT